MDKRSETSLDTESSETDFRKLEEEGEPGSESGRVNTESKDDRPEGKSTGRDSTGINPEDPIDPKSPNLIGP